MAVMLCLEGNVPNTPFVDNKSMAKENIMAVDEDTTGLEAPKSTKFELKSIISHKGNTQHSGHYVCHTRYNDKWILMNDNYVMEDDAVELEKAYLLFYYNTDLMK